MNNTLRPFGSVLALIVALATGMAASPAAALEFELSPGSPNFATLDPPGIAGPSAPSNLVATVISTDEIQLSWTDNATSETGYDLIRRMTTGPAHGPNVWTQLGPLPPDTTSFSDVGSVDTHFNRYIYQLRSRDGALVSFWVPTPATPMDPPAAPSNVVTTAVTPECLRVTWTDNADNENNSRWKIRTPSQTWGPSLNARFDQNGSEAEMTVFQRDFPPGTTALSDIFRIQLQARNSGNGSAWALSNWTTQPTVLPPPSVQAVIVSTSQIDVSWADSSTTETRIDIDRKSPGSPWAAFVSLPSDSTSFSDTSVDAARNRYSYRVRFVDGSCSTMPADSAFTPVAVPDAPTGLTASLATWFSARLDWADNGPNETSYDVWRRTTTTPWAFHVSLPEDTTSWTDFGLTTATVRYKYFVRARNSGNVSAPAYSNWTPPPPAGSTMVTATVISSARVDVSWDANATNETSYELWRRTLVAGWSLVASLPPDTATYSDLGVDTTVDRYRYFVRARNQFHVSKVAYSSFTPLLPPGMLIHVTSTEMTEADDGWCTLPEAIRAANRDTASGVLPGECAAGRGPDRVILEPFGFYQVAEAVEDWSGPTGLPGIRSDVTLQGRGATLELLPASRAFRLLAIGPRPEMERGGATLVLRDVVFRTEPPEPGELNAGSRELPGRVIFNRGDLVFSGVWAEPENASRIDEYRVGRPETEDQCETTLETALASASILFNDDGDVAWHSACGSPVARTYVEFQHGPLAKSP